MTKQFEMKDFKSDLFERMQDMNRAWLERLREIRQIESDFGSRLLTAKSSSEAATVCNEWMARRLETVAGVQQAFTTAWIELMSELMKSTSATSAEGSE
jgi:hypothetical protein